MVLNPTKAPIATLTFPVAATGTTVDDMGNVVPVSTTGNANAILTPLSQSSLGQVQESLGTDRAGFPFKLRAATTDGRFPANIRRGKITEATLTYDGRPALIAFMVGPINHHSLGAGLLAIVGESALGILTYT